MSFKPTDTSERGFQRLITQHLVGRNGYQESQPSDFDREFCLNTGQLFGFIKDTQLTAYEAIQKKGERDFLHRLDMKIKELGVIEVMRKGLKFYDKQIDLFYRKPVSNYNLKARALYDANVFSVTQELKYSLANENRLDLVVFLNGIPLATFELKNAYTHQAVQHAIRQYMSDRDPKEKLFSFARCIVHFAADTDLVYMATELKGGKTRFLPFNKGLNDGLPDQPWGAGNPLNPNGLKTHYLWEEVLTKDNLSNILDKFVKVVKEKDEDTKREKKKLIFPRYHQLTCVRRLLNHVQENGVGERYLVQHSAGSGKSNSITWLAHQLTGLYDKTGENLILDSVIVVTDRTVLDKQLRDNIKQFSHTRGTVEAITGEGGSKTEQLRTALGEGKKIIITTVQTFPFLLDGISELQTRRFAIIIDEAHSSQSGETAAKMNAVLSASDEDEETPTEETMEEKIIKIIQSRKMIKNGSYFAFTATPKNKTLEMFGVPRKVDKPDGGIKTQFFPFHLYSMKQAIEEGFILDVLENYTTYNSYYKLMKSVEDNPAYETKQAQKKLRSYVEGHEHAIKEKAKIMVDHFNREVHKLIRGEAKAMVVTKSIISAIKYKQAFDEYLKELHSPYKAIVAFTGSKPYKGIDYTETGMNSFPDKLNDIPKQFKKNEYKFLIVAEKYQTGFDQPLLHTMYVDKKLSDVQAVQTLSRLNRCCDGKRDTFVLDFYNKAEDIKEAFAPYFTSTNLSEETDPNKLHDLQDALDRFDIYSEETVKDFFFKYATGVERTVIDPIIDSVVAIFDNELEKDKQIDFKMKAKSFLRTYSYLAKITDFTVVYWEELWWFLKLLVPKLKIDSTGDLAEGILEAVDLDSYRPSKETTQKINLLNEPGVVDPIPVTVRGGTIDPEFDLLENILSNFNKRFGDIEWSDRDKVNKFLKDELPAQVKSDDAMTNALQYSDRQNARIKSDKRVDDLMIQYLQVHTEVYKKYMSDPDFKRKYQEFVFDTVWDDRERVGR
ncbi:MAG: DEAD/DEAH box helicase family protein [Saprospiraceae bacterium]